MELFRNENTDPGPEGIERSDQEIRSAILKLFSENDYLKDRKIQVKVAKGVVTLEGIVFTRQSWERAQDLAADVRGTQEVQNHIKVEPGPASPSD